MFSFVYDFGVRRLIMWAIPSALVLIIVLFGAIQLVPKGRDHTNPPVVSEIEWDSPQTREFAARACLDCHSNEVRWPWYSNIAPMSWLVQDGVDRAREDLNFSEWQSLGGPGTEFMGTVRARGMPPCDYLWLHPDAKLSGEELRAFTAGMELSLGIDIPDGKQAENGDGFLRCAKNRVVYPFIPKPLRSTRLLVSGVGLVGIAGVALISSYVIYHRRRSSQG